MSEPVHVNDIAPTPERGWLWRRLYSFLRTAAFIALMAALVLRITDPNALREVALMLALLLALDTLLYMGGATLTDIWRLVSAVRTSRHISECRRDDGAPSA